MSELLSELLGNSGKLALTKNDILSCAEKTYLVLGAYANFFEGLTMYNKNISKRVMYANRPQKPEL